MERCSSTTQSTTPSFSVRLVEPAIAFCCNRPGFEPAMKDPADDPFFAIIDRDGVRIFVKAILPAEGPSRHGLMKSRDLRVALLFVRLDLARSAQPPEPEVFQQSAVRQLRPTPQVPSQRCRWVLRVLLSASVVRCRGRSDARPTTPLQPTSGATRLWCAVRSLTRRLRLSVEPLCTQTTRS